MACCSSPTARRRPSPPRRSATSSCCRWAGTTASAPRSCPSRSTPSRTGRAPWSGGAGRSSSSSSRRSPRWSRRSRGTLRATSSPAATRPRPRTWRSWPARPRASRWTACRVVRASSRRPARPSGTHWFQSQQSAAGFSRAAMTMERRIGSTASPSCTLRPTATSRRRRPRPASPVPVPWFSRQTATTPGRSGTATTRRRRRCSPR
mmetsp:Transcript_33981/g.95556  ORF Transcript_33981/g.95556 Transcript_33981/m.95556 type:complete len:206 (+) Transcript_33981:615-1232(+)